MEPEERDAIIRMLDAAMSYQKDIDLIGQAKKDMCNSDNPMAYIMICADGNQTKIGLTPADIDCICNALMDRMDTIKRETKIKIMNMFN